MLSLCMIVKNESKVLERCLESVKKHLSLVLDDIVIVDTGSTDNTVEIAKKYTDKNFYFEWCNDFSKARNYSISKAKNDWVLILDADEYIEEVDINEIINLMDKKYSDVKFAFQIIELNDENEPMGKTRVTRIFNRKFFHYESIIHEQVTPIENKIGRKYNLKLICKHTGYSQETVNEKSKIKRNEELILKHLENFPEDLYMVGQLGLTYKSQNKFDEAIKYLEKAIFNEYSTDRVFYATFVVEYMKIYMARDQYEIAAICSNLWEYCKYDDVYLYHLAICFIKTNNAPKAVEVLQAFVDYEGQTFTDKKEAYYLLGQIFESAGQNDEAINYYQHCTEYADVLSRINKLKLK